MSNRFHIPPATGKSRVLHADGITDDIITAILEVHESHRHQLQHLAEQFRGMKAPAVIQALHGFIRQHIAYVLDPPGDQWIKTPARTWADRQADCKGYSLFAASVLHALGIPYVFRFVSFTEDPTPTHVYIVAKEGRELPLDACLPAAFVEKKFTHKQDRLMSKISMLSGIGDPGMMLEGDMELLLSQEQAALEAQILGSRVSGIGQLSEALVMSAQRKNAAGITVTPRAETSEEKEAARQIIEEILPEAAPVFLYLFINDRETLSQLPPEAKTKREEAVAAARYFQELTGMSDTIFLKIVRNSLMRKSGQTPEQLVLSMMTGSVSGIGLAFLPFLGKAVGVVKKGIQIGKRIFGKKKETPPAPPAPQPPAAQDFSRSAPVSPYLQASSGKIQNVQQAQRAAQPTTYFPQGPMQTQSQSLAPIPQAAPPRAAGAGGGLPKWALPAAGLGLAAMLFLRPSGGRRRRR